MKLNFNNAAFVRSAADERGFPRDGRPRVIFAGRSNVGKSSTINTLLGRKFARISGTPGKTVFVNLFLVDDRLWFIDLPGYGYAKVSKTERERFSKLIDSYLITDLPNIRLMVLIVDARHEPTADDRTMLEWMRTSGAPILILANKLDKLKPSEREQNLAVIRETLVLDETIKLIGFSSEKQINKEDVLSFIRQAAQGYGTVQ
ncbi:MAG: ribosome biogenesis GTP-binding protein YihA/YsxC [Clostridiaceae bacterium]|nr:ribosome biogenesis GTP-binding protein YihA/YsxC [Clostridiaceae bacterium]